MSGNISTLQSPVLGSIKDPERLKRQLDRANEIAPVLPADPAFSDLAKSALDPTKVLESWRDILTRYAVRAKAYTDIVRALGALLRNGGTANQSEIDPGGEKTLPDIRRHIEALNNVRSAALDYEAAPDGEGLRKHQRRVFQALARFLEEGHERGYVKLPTGAGKTAIFACLAKALGLKTLVLVPTKDLVSQTEGKPPEEYEGKLTDDEIAGLLKGFAKFADGLKVSTFYSRSKDITGQVVVSTYHSLPKLLEQAKLANASFDLVICDEAHRSLTEKRQAAISEIPGAIATVAFSATLEFADQGKNVQTHYPKEIFSMNLPEAIEAQICCGVKFGVMDAIGSLNDVRFDGRGEILEEDADNKLDLDDLDRKVCALMSTTHKDDAAVAFCASVKHAQELAEKLNDRGIKAAAIWGDMDDSLRKNTIDAYNRGEIQFLCNRNVLIEGWDAPRACVGFMLAPTLSPINAEQRLGRLLRLLSGPDGAITPKIAMIWEPVWSDSRGISGAEIVGQTESIPQRPEYFGALTDLEIKLSASRSQQLHTKIDEVAQIMRDRPNLNVLRMNVPADAVRRVLLEGEYLSAEELFNNEVTITTRSGRAVTARGKDIFEAYLRSKESDPTDGGSAEHAQPPGGEQMITAIASKIFKKADERKAYLTLRENSQAARKLVFEDGDSRLGLSRKFESALRTLLLTEKPHLSELHTYRFGDLPARCALGVLGINDLSAYRSFLERICAASDYSLLLKHEMDEMCKEVPYWRTPSGFEVELSKLALTPKKTSRHKINPEPVSEFRKSLGFVTRAEANVGEVNLVPYSPASKSTASEVRGALVSKRAFVAALREFCDEIELSEARQTGNLTRLNRNHMIGDAWLIDKRTLVNCLDIENGDFGKAEVHKSLRRRDEQLSLIEQRFAVAEAASNDSLYRSLAGAPDEAFESVAALRKSGFRISDTDVSGSTLIDFHLDRSGGNEEKALALLAANHQKALKKLNLSSMR